MPEEKPIEPTKTVKSQNWFAKHKILTVIIVLVLIGLASSASGKKDVATTSKTSSNDSSKTSASVKADDTKTVKEDLSAVAKEYTLTAGYFTAGIDLPAGECNVIAVSGTGNLSSSNIYSGGVNEMFGVDDGSGLYTASFNGLKFPKSTKLSLNGDLVVKLTFTQIDSNFSGRTYDENSATTLSSGNYTAGKDFPVGIYKIIAISGTGNLSSSNIYDGGVNEMFGADDGSGLYNAQFLNAELNDKVTLTISGGLTIKLIPTK
jgi:hypothetical protein